MQEFPRALVEHPHNNAEAGGVSPPGGLGHPLIDHGQPYAPNLVPRGDYTRVLAEFWADGPDLKRTGRPAVTDHPCVGGLNGPEMSPLEWDAKAALGGAVHDAGIPCAKGYFRHVTAIRFMAAKGQSSEPEGVNYHEEGIPPVPNGNRSPGDPFGGFRTGKRGQDRPGAYGLRTHRTWQVWGGSENWWPYQRPSFVTPPFAGYVSGHSTFFTGRCRGADRLHRRPVLPRRLMGHSSPRRQVFEQGHRWMWSCNGRPIEMPHDQSGISRIWGFTMDDIPVV